MKSEAENIPQSDMNREFNKKVKLLALFSLFWVSVVFAQETTKGLVFEFSDFSGGLVSKPSQHSLTKKQATIAENVRFNTETGSISDRDAIRSYGIADANESITGMHRLYLKDGTKVLLVTHGDEIEKGDDTTGNFTTILNLTTGDYRWQGLTWNNIAIKTDGYNQPVKYDGTSASATYLGSCLATDAGSGAGPNGTYTYKVSCYSANYNIGLGAPSNTLIVSDNDINLTMIPICPDTILGETTLGRQVYRTETGGSTYKLLSNGNITNNTDTTLADSDADGALGAALSVNYTYTPPKGKILLVHENRLFIANNPDYPSRIYYSEDASPDYFISDSYFNIRADDGDQITFVKDLLGILTISKDNTIQKLYTSGDTPASDWSISSPFSFIGCRALYTAVNSPYGIIYLANDGIYSFNGQNSVLLSDVVTPEIKDILESNLRNCWGEFHKNAYYLAYTSKKSGEATNNRVLVYDFLSNAFSIDLLDINAFCTFKSGTDWDVLYSGASYNGTVNAHAWQENEIIHKRHSDFTGNWSNARYIPVAWGGNADSPVIEIARTATIDDLTDIIDNQTGTIDRNTLTGNYTSPFIPSNAVSYNKLYWNERMPSVGGDVTIAIRSNATEATCNATSWSSEYSDPSGSDISGVTASNYLQYRITLTTNNYTASPEVYNANNYVVRLTYNTEGSVTETSVPLHWISGWLDFGYPNNDKVLKKLITYHKGTGGTLTLKFENFEGENDTFNINLVDHPASYEEYFTNGAFLGSKFKLDIANNDLNATKIEKVIVVYDVEPAI